MFRGPVVQCTTSLVVHAGDCFFVTARDEMHPVVPLSLWCFLMSRMSTIEYTRAGLHCGLVYALVVAHTHNQSNHFHTLMGTKPRVDR